MKWILVPIFAIFLLGCETATDTGNPSVVLTPHRTTGNYQNANPNMSASKMMSPLK